MSRESIWVFALVLLLPVLSWAEPVSDTLVDGGGGIYTIDATDYEVQVYFIAESCWGREPTVRFVINGVMTNALGEGRSHVTGGVRITVDDIFITGPDRSVVFVLERVPGERDSAWQTIAPDADVHDTLLVELDHENGNADADLKTYTIGGREYKVTLDEEDDAFFFLCEDDYPWVFIHVDDCDAHFLESSSRRFPYSLVALDRLEANRDAVLVSFALDAREGTRCGDGELFDITCDGFRERREECDDGDDDNTDGCTSECLICGRRDEQPQKARCCEGLGVVASDGFRIAEQDVCEPLDGAALEFWAFQGGKRSIILEESIVAVWSPEVFNPRGGSARASLLQVVHDYPNKVTDLQGDEYSAFTGSRPTLSIGVGEEMVHAESRFELVEAEVDADPRHAKLRISKAMGEENTYRLDYSAFGVSRVREGFDYEAECRVNEGAQVSSILKMPQYEFYLHPDRVPVWGEDFPLGFEVVDVTNPYSGEPTATFIVRGERFEGVESGDSIFLGAWEDVTKINEDGVGALTLQVDDIVADDDKGSVLLHQEYYRPSYHGSCIDYDGGLDFVTPGVVETDVRVVRDRCGFFGDHFWADSDSETLFEVSCREGYPWVETIHRCLDRCVDGRCCSGAECEEEVAFAGEEQAVNETSGNESEQGIGGCVDSDGGVNVSVRGVACRTEVQRCLADGCRGDDVLIESFCRKTNDGWIVDTQEHICPQGTACREGMCIAVSASACPPAECAQIGSRCEGGVRLVSQRCTIYKPPACEAEVVEQVRNVGACVQDGRCGDGVVDAGEQCDDGNEDGTDGCLPSCRQCMLEGVRVESRSGVGCCDGLVDREGVCRHPDLGGCPNGVLEAGEECDDGDADERDGCTSWCERCTTVGERIQLIAGVASKCCPGLEKRDGLCLEPAPCDGCRVDGSCLGVGKRIDGSYCSEQGGLKPQVVSGGLCAAHHECVDGFCQEGVCRDAGALRRIVLWFFSWWG